MKIGTTELILIFIVALVVLGPDKLPYYAKKLGESLKQFKKYSSEATKDIREGIVDPLNEAAKPLKEAMEPVEELQKTVKDEVNDLKKSFNDIGKDIEKSLTEEPVEDGTEDPAASVRLRISSCGRRRVYAARLSEREDGSEPGGGRHGHHHG